MAIDRRRVIEALSRMEFRGDENGLIPGFGIFLQRLPAGFWNSFAERLTRSVDAGSLEAAEWLLVNAAQECGYHTAHGIMASEEWAAVIGPMVERVPEDHLHGIVAAFTAWGWARFEIVELEPGTRLVIRAYDYYEADGTRYGAARRPCAYMVRGVAAAFMDLVYGGVYDPTGHTGLRTFTCAQTRGIECGDDYGEFVVTRAA